MRKYMFHNLILLILLFTSYLAKAQVVNIPDPIFLEHLINQDIDTNGDGQIQNSEAEAIDTLDISYTQAQSLIGLGSFKNLKYLNVSSNNKVTELDVSGFTNLLTLNISGLHGLNVLNINGLPKLMEMKVSWNYILTNLDLSGLVSLTSLHVLSNGALTTLDINTLTNLTDLRITDNDRLSDVEISTLTHLEFLHIESDKILTSFDLSLMPNLVELSLFGKGAEVIELSSLINLTSLQIGANDALTNLFLSDLPNLTGLTVGRNKVLKSLDLSSLSSLQELSVSYNDILTRLNLNGLSQLTSLFIYENESLRSLDLTSLTNVIEFYFSSNEDLVNLSLSSFSNLKKAQIKDNKSLRNLDLSNLTKLKELVVSENEALDRLKLISMVELEVLDISTNDALTDLEIQELTKLESLSINDTKALINLSLSSLPSLHDLSIRNNELLPSLDLSSLTNLIELDLTWNTSLLNVDFSSLTKLEDIYIARNPLLEIIQLDFLNKLKSLALWSNDALSEIYIRSNQTNKIDYISISESLQPLKFICANPQDIPNIIGNLEQNQNYTCLVTSLCTSGSGKNIITGSYVYDELKDGCDDSDVGLPYAKLEVVRGGEVINKFTDVKGEYELGLAKGSYTLYPTTLNPSFFEVLPDSVAIEFNSDSSYNMQDFCVQARNEFLDLETSVAPSTQARPGFESRYLITYANKGTARKSGTVDLVFEDNKIDYISADLVPDTIETGRLSWNFNELLPFESRTIEVTMELNRPTDDPPLNGGDILRFITHIKPDYLDVTPENNVDELVQTVVNSFDPNDKTCLAGNVINPDFIDAYVKYLIRFENTGSAEAIHVLVEDEIDTTTFDINTLEIINSSHPMEVLITEGNQVSFQFDSILLPFDDANNDGFILFKIKTKPTLEIGDTLQNIAAIYFDYNLPIITNNAITKVDDYIGIRPVAHDDIKINLTPNPAHAVVDITSEYGIQRIEMVNSQGQTIRSIDLLGAQSNYQLDVREFTAGMYVVRLHTSAGIASRKMVKQ